MSVAHAAKSLTRVALITAALVVAAPALANAATVHVKTASAAPDATCGAADAPCRTLDAAVARSNGGDTLLLAAGQYDGTTIAHPLTLQGPSAGTAVIISQLTLEADVAVDGLTFRSALVLRAGTGAPANLGPRIANSVFENSTITSQGAFSRLRITGSRFVGSGTGTAIRLLVNPSTGTVIEHNTFEGLAIAVQASQAHDAVIRSNETKSIGTLLSVSQSTGMNVTDNVGTGFGARALYVRGHVSDLTVERNRLSSTAGSTVEIDGNNNDGITLQSNSFDGFDRVVTANGTFTGTLTARSNRFLVSTPAAASNGTIDLRANWWGSNAALTSSGSVDASAQLRLVGVDAPAELHLSASSGIAARLVTALGSTVHQSPFLAATFTTTNGTLGARVITFNYGTAGTYLVAPTAVGSTTTTATLDNETVSATTAIVRSAAEVTGNQALPSTADSRPPVRKKSVLRTRIGVDRRTLRTALSRGIVTTLRTNRKGRYHVVLTITPAEARRLGLRSKRSRTRTMYVIGRARGTIRKTGTRRIRVKLTKRAKYAIRRNKAQRYIHTEIRFRANGSKRTVSNTRTNMLSRLVR